MKYRKKPVVIEAVKWDGADEAYEAILALARRPPSPAPEVQTRSLKRNDDGTLDIATLEGTMKASVGDFVIRGVSHELYPCKPDIFEKTYEAVDG